jgi:hypothetical protein
VGIYFIDLNELIGRKKKSPQITQKPLPINYIGPKKYIERKRNIEYKTKIES